MNNSTTPSTPAAMEPLPPRPEMPAEQMLAAARQTYALLRQRRTVRDFDAARPVARELVEQCLLAAGTAPSGANQQPWHFVVITDATIKHQIREAAEAEERSFYSGRAPQEWLNALAPLGTDASKPFLDEAPLLIAIFAQKYGVDPATGQRFSHYYVPESVGIATGFLIEALHRAGLATLTHTPSPMGFLTRICGRPEAEKPVILLVVGHPKPGCQVPVHGGVKKKLDQFTSWL
ncbi:nitroreductase family protein [Pelomonas sp. SE-A7]|uniref:nitroreductase family protein n=1 Tax=Pelomonas sp. SE-A7 TaxID=3054953 RepID=UPI00259D0854|nr:nitroreductase family protein [Pelomonas sp. SE-A7]MDM4768538.1 nitroreductase family protein [Pelomonas sp. SE-A7]